MRLSILVCLFLMVGHSIFAQSKKELEAQINSLKAEIEQLKKPKEVALDDKHKKASYGLGVLMASNLKTQGADSLNIEALTAAVSDVLLGRPLKMEQQESMSIVQQYMQEAAERKSSAQKEPGRKFLEENKKTEGVTVTPSGLQYKVITSGQGKSPGTNDKVTVHYTGKLIDGTVFDSSVERGQPATFGVTQVIKGWTEALQMMKEGDKWILYIPSDLAYGDRGAGAKIPPHSTLIFEVKLINVN